MKPYASASYGARLAFMGLSLAILANGATAGGAPDNLQALPEAEQAVMAPAPVQEVTPIREQNAVVSVRVKRGDNTYYVTPSEQFSHLQSGGRAAQWQIFEFRPKKESTGSAAPPPSLQR